MQGSKPIACDLEIYPSPALSTIWGLEAFTKMPICLSKLCILKFIMCLKLDLCAADSCFLTTKHVPAVETLKFPGGQGPDAAGGLRYQCRMWDGGWQGCAFLLRCPAHQRQDRSLPTVRRSSLGSGIPWKSFDSYFPTFLCHHFKKLPAFFLTNRSICLAYIKKECAN